ncbi:hypothetical protein CASFOL_026910 [Castilleja foliolosa]|uniref:AUGMIN subunit 8 n=1 Tax=Castilleja foliolosa TaxID=1961234 RepID=A0ABD3CJ82_9LAMI
MDVCKSAKALHKQSTPERKRQPLVPAENKNKNGATFRAQTREVSSRYRSPTPSAAKRFPSPNAARLSSTTSTVLAPKRAISTERKRPSRPSSPPSPTTPVQDTSAETMLASRKSVGNKLAESLWPSTMRSLSVSFQSDTYSIPFSSRREKPVSPSDRTLRTSSNISASSRKPTPERKSPLKGKKSTDQSENYKPVDGLHSRLVDKNRWPSRTSGKFPTSLNRSIDLGDKMSNKSSTLSLRRLSLDGGASKPLLKSSSDLLIQISRDDDQMQRPGSSGSSDRALSSRTLGSRAQSPSVSRGVSPSRAKPLITPRGPSPARERPSSPSRQPQSSTSVLSFIVDIKKGKKAANHIEDVHQLRLLYNRHLQWRYVNARTCAALQSQKVQSEEMLYTVWIIIVDLWDSLMEKRIELQQLRLKLKLFSVLNNQLTCLDEWTSNERDHVKSLTWAIQDLQASTIRVPVTGGARGDVVSVKAAICSAVDVMQAMGSSLFTILSRVEGMNSLVSELADVAAQERAMLDECESVLGSTTVMQSGRTQPYDQSITDETIFEK